jgi:hypothetical protein
MVFFGSFWTIMSRSSQKFLGYFFPRNILCTDFDKNVLGLIVGEFFTNSSGHPGYVAGFVKEFFFGSANILSRKNLLCGNSTRQSTNILLRTTYRMQLKIFSAKKKVLASSLRCLSKDFPISKTLYDKDLI